MGIILRWSLQDLQTIIDLNSGDNAGDYAGYGDNANQIAVAKILQAWIYQHLTDAFGDIPMSQALQGVSNTTPAYDSQASVYAALITMLDDAMDGMTSVQGHKATRFTVATWTNGPSLLTR